MRRVTALLLLAAVSGPQAAPLVTAARSAAPALSAPAEADPHHHHPPGCPWQGTPDCPHAHHGPSSQPTWSPCAEVPLALAGEARMAWAPPADVADAASAPAIPASSPSSRAQAPPSGPTPDIEIPPPRTAHAV